ncbi:MAG: aminoacyl-tRNA hydrolase [Nitrospira sp.]|nr:aminoacyl-tRNA hydrolase [Nitrospira sp.]
MWLIAGLGNPGRKYERTRHNVGFMVIEEFACRNNIDLRDKKTFRIGRGSADGNDILLVKPLLYMNLSGHVIQDMLRKFSIEPANLIVIHDDLDMETGKLRIRKTGSSGGHKGIESIIDNTGSRDFLRVKIGIGREEGMPAEDYVLRKFRREELAAMKEAIQKAADVIYSIITEGVDKTMNRYN